MRAASRAMRTSRCVESSAAISSRQTGCEDGIARHAQILALVEPGLVLGVERGAPARAPQDRRDAGVVLDQQRAGGRAHEHLDAGRARQPLQLRDVLRRCRACRRPRRRNRNACGAFARATLSARASAVVVSGLVFGISNTAVTPPRTAAARARFQIFLVGQARLAEMHLRVDDAGQDGEAGGSRCVSPALSSREVADRRDFAAPDANVARADAIMIDDDAAAQDQIEGLRHGAIHGYKGLKFDRLAGRKCDTKSAAQAASRGSNEDRICLLADRGVVRMAGAEAQGFLQRLITASVKDIAPGESRFSALLSPQGKLLFDFFVVPLPEGAEAGFLIDCARDQSAALAQRLNLHKLRAKIAIEDQSDALGVAAVLDGDAPGSDRRRRLPRFPRARHGPARHRAVARRWRKSPRANDGRI